MWDLSQFFTLHMASPKFPASVNTGLALIFTGGFLPGGHTSDSTALFIRLAVTFGDGLGSSFRVFRATLYPQLLLVHSVHHTSI